jgi:predicted nucleic acid-binding protein
VILVDTSIWIDHLRSGDQHLAILLERGRVAMHKFVVGEMACGNLRNRQEVIALMSSLPGPVEASHEEVLYFIDRHRLMGRGIGYVDASLLAAASLSAMPIWTRDKRLVAVAEEMAMAYRPGDDARSRVE